MNVLNRMTAVSSAATPSAHTNAFAILVFKLMKKNLRNVKVCIYQWAPYILRAEAWLLKVRAKMAQLLVISIPPTRVYHCF